MPDQTPPVLRRACQWCHCGKHAIQYLGERRDQSTTTYDKPGVCLVCPLCDSPSGAEVA